MDSYIEFSLSPDKKPSDESLKRMLESSLILRP